MQVLLNRMNGTDLAARASANLEFAPACFAPEGQNQPALFNGNLYFTIVGLSPIDIKAYDLGAAETTSVADQRKAL